MSEAVDRLAARLGLVFRRPELLEIALTHRSYANEQGLEQNYERLEFLGDAVLGLVSAEWLFDTRPAESEGGLSELNAFLVSRPVLARHAIDLGLGDVLRLGVGEERSGGRSKPSLLADSLEAVIGAIFLDSGLETVRATLVPMFAAALEGRDELTRSEAKTRLQELTQARSWTLPEYRHVAEEGPDHQKRFSVECWIDGRRVAEATGPSKKIAEQRAARDALRHLADSPMSADD